MVYYDTSIIQTMEALFSVQFKNITHDTGTHAETTRVSFLFTRITSLTFIQCMEGRRLYKNMNIIE